MTRRKKNTIVTDSTGTYLLVVSKTFGTVRCYFDLEDLEKVEQHTWGLRKSATRREGADLEVGTTLCGVTRTTISLHRHLFTVVAPLVTDHIDCDILNCRKSNLRAVTPQQNQFNRSNAKGYSWVEESQSYRARIILNKQFIDLGYFATEEAASAAYLCAKSIYHTY